MKNLYTIMPLNMSHINEICDDVIYQVKNNIASCALFKMTLVPEGNPPVDKATTLCEIYKKFKSKLDNAGIPNGVLVQATIGHGYGRILGEMFPYQKYVGIVNGNADTVVCPYDEGFKEYIFDVFQKIAKTNPDHIMLDDDFRLMSRVSGGCGCPLHMKRFNELAGTNLNREQLWEILGKESETALRYNDIFVETQKEAMLNAAKVMRAGIDSVNPKIPGSYCCVGENAECAAEVAKIMAGDGNDVIVRINNGRYNAPGPGNLTLSFFWAAAQIAKLKNNVDVILDETDTCPQNRYSTGKMMLHSHFTGGILEGAAGAKHWITRLVAYEPESGRAYRDILSKNSKFYDAVSEISKNVKWEGFRIPVREKPYYRIGKTIEKYNAWCKNVLEKMGLPMYFSSDDGGILCLEGDLILSDEQIKKALGGFVMLASDSAKQLIDRGFGEYLGVDVKNWDGKNPMADKILCAKNVVSKQPGINEIVVTDQTAYVDSVICHTVDNVNYEELFPGTVIYKNSLGGTVVTFAGTPETEFTITAAFSFLNWSRKQQLINILKLYGAFSVYCPGDEEIYLRSGKTADGQLICTIFNLGLDPVDNIELVVNKKFNKIQKLMSDGSKCDVAYKEKDGKILLDCPAYTLNPVILFID